jgi:hypothetical protein
MPEKTRSELYRDLIAIRNEVDATESVMVRADSVTSPEYVEARARLRELTARRIELYTAMQSAEA